MAEKIDKKEFAWIINTFKEAEIFAGLDYAEREALVDDMFKVTFKKDSIIFKEGDLPNACFVLFQGKLKVVKNKMMVLKKEVSILEPGAFFGEMAFVTYAPRAATVIVEEDSTCFVLRKATIQKLLKENEGFKKWVSTLSERRMMQLQSI